MNNHINQGDITCKHLNKRLNNTKLNACDVCINKIQEGKTWTNKNLYKKNQNVQMNIQKNGLCCTYYIYIILHFGRVEGNGGI